MRDGDFSRSELNIAKDPFIESKEFKDYEEFKFVNGEVQNAIDGDDVVLTDDFIPNYQSLNSDFWLVYYQAGKYYFKQKEYSKAKTEFEKACF